LSAIETLQRIGAAATDVREALLRASAAADPEVATAARSALDVLDNAATRPQESGVTPDGR